MPYNDLLYSAIRIPDSYWQITLESVSEKDMLKQFRKDHPDLEILSKDNKSMKGIVILKTREKNP
jgi:hypothetical protein